MTTAETFLALAPERIAIFRALFLGDLLMTTPAFRALRRRFPAAEITLIGLPWAADFVHRSAAVIDRFVPFVGYEGIIEVPFEAERTAHWLVEQRAYGYDLAIQMHGDGNVTNGLLVELDARHTLGIARPGDTRLDRAQPLLGGNEVLRWLSLMAELGASQDDTRLMIDVFDDDVAAAAALLAELSPSGPLIALHPGAKDLARRWPVERFAVLGDALVEQYNATMLITGAASERDLTASLHAAMRAPAVDLGGRTTLGAFAALISRLDLLVTNDTGASHVAAACRTPSVVIFGPTRPEVFAPLDRALHQVVDALAYGATLATLPIEPVFSTCAQQLHLLLGERSVGGVGL
jgi:ADP-heptose:LPS heptosyltransferase